MALRLADLGIHAPHDLLFHLPGRYEDRTRITPIAQLPEGQAAVCAGRVANVQERFGRRRSLLAEIHDDSGRLFMRLFHFARRQKQQLASCGFVRLVGIARRGPLGLEMVHPEYRLLPQEQAMSAPEQTLTPVYRTVSGLGQGRLRDLIAQALAQMRVQATLPELLPSDLLRADWPALADALEYLHNPPADADLAILASGRHPAQRRLVFEELLAHRLCLQLARNARRSGHATALQPARLVRLFRDKLPFALTAAQQRVAAEIERDLAQTAPMLRLVQGDVGSGKTVVAAQAALTAIDSGLQALFMAPTELLAAQHHANLRAWCERTGVRVLLLTGAMGKREREAAAQQIQAGEAELVVGTHALFQQGVEFSRVGLVIVDEQHRFGVQQRLALRDKGRDWGRTPHQLVMTATPIPRTLAQTYYADLDLSVIDEMPPGRKPVTTVAMAESRRAQIVERVHVACREGRQVYWVCPLIEESDLGESAQATQESLQAALPDVRVGLVHGRMSGKDKRAVMDDFAAARIDLLVATTVIEVGVDVPQASLMVIENAERLGLSQLHQLRGRVGRGSQDSHCVLLYRAPLTDMARARLDTMRLESDGFAIAQRDLELRGPGELLGARQSGEADFRLAELMRDADLLSEVAGVAQWVTQHAVDRIDPLIGRWIGDAARFAQA